MKAYNLNHPKGRQFTDKELIQHRDNWYRKIKQSGGLVAKPEYIEMDKHVYQTIKTLLHIDGVMKFIREHDFGGRPFDRKILEPIYEFINLCEKPEFEFIDVDLEGLRLELHGNCSIFRECLSEYFFGVDDESDNISLPKEWKYGENKFRDLWEEGQRKTNESSNQLFDTFSDLVKLGRRKLLI